MKKPQHTLFGSEKINEKVISYRCCFDLTRDPQILFSAGSQVSVRVQKRNKNSKESYLAPLVRILHDTSNNGYYALVPNKQHDKLIKAYLNSIEPSHAPLEYFVDTTRLYEEWKDKCALPHLPQQPRVKSEAKLPQVFSNRLRPVNPQLDYKDKQIIIRSDARSGQKNIDECDDLFDESDDVFRESDCESDVDSEAQEITPKSTEKKVTKKIEKKKPTKKPLRKNKHKEFIKQEASEFDEYEEDEEDEKEEEKLKMNKISRVKPKSTKRVFNEISDPELEYELKLIREIEDEEYERIERAKLNNMQAHFHEDWHQRKLKLFDQRNQRPSL